MKDKILEINADLKYIEEVLAVFDQGEETQTLKEIRDKFKNKFGLNNLFPLINQRFGIIRLLPLMLIKEVKQREDKISDEDYKNIQIIRNAISHLQFDYDEKGYSFTSKQGAVRMSYDEIVPFVHRIENEFYAKEL